MAVSAQAASENGLASARPTKDARNMAGDGRIAATMADDNSPKMLALLDFIAGKVGSLETEMRSLEPEMRSVGERLDRIEVKVDRLEVKVDRLEAKFDRLETRVEALEARP
jgi:phage shock protein A